MLTNNKASTSLRARCAALGLSALIMSCAAEDGDQGSSTLPTFEQFKARSYDPAFDVYVVEGDLVMSESELKTYYESAVADDEVDTSADGDAPLLIGNKNGADITWDSFKVNNLTYCIDKKSFGDKYSQMMQTVYSASSAWEEVAHVTFVHDFAQDDNCTSRTGVVFNVTSHDFGDNTAARAFFPDDPRNERQVLVDKGQEGSVGVLTHELGHVLGFRHENNRGSERVRDDENNGGCSGFEDSAWRALTENDGTRSIMNCSTPAAKSLSARDIRGAACLYGDKYGNLPSDCGIPGVSYRAHIGQFGWQGTVVNNDVAGSQGEARDIQAIEISQNLRADMHICYRVHVAKLGWLQEACDGAMAGTTGQGLSMQAIEIHLVNAPPGCSVSYRAHLAHTGWQATVSDGATSGTVGESRGLQALRVELNSACR